MNGRIEPDSDDYAEIIKAWDADGRPRDVTFRGGYYMAMQDNDKLVFILLGGAANLFEQMYKSTTWNFDKDK